MSEDVVGRAFAAYYQAAVRSGEIYQQPANTSGIAEHQGKRYVKLENTHGTLAVYRVRNTGMLRRLKRWPTAIEEA